MDLKEFLASPRKIIARPKKGQAIKGYLRNGRTLSRGSLRLRTVEGEELAVDLQELKGIFFVRDFEGNKSYLEDKLLAVDPDRKGLRVRLRFEDNETMEGVAENSLELLQAPGFFFWPADPVSNNELIYVVRSALLGFRVIGVKN